MKIYKNENFNDIVKINTFIYKLHEKDMKMDYHSHSELELTYVLDGKVELNYFNKKKHCKQIVLSEQLLIINKNVVHKLKFPVDTTLLVLEIEEINNNLTKYFETNSIINSNTKLVDFFKLQEPLVKTIMDVSSISGKMKYLIEFEKEKRTKKDDLTNLEFHIHFKDFLLSVFKSYLTREKQRNIHVNECLNYIHNNLSSKLTIDIIANEINISPAYIKKLFKNELGTSIYEYIINERIKLAIEYLKTTDLSQKDIAKKVGFSSYNSFYKCFVTKTNTKPNEYQTSDVKDMQYFNFDFKNI